MARDENPWVVIGGEASVGTALYFVGRISEIAIAVHSGTAIGGAIMLAARLQRLMDTGGRDAVRGTDLFQVFATLEAFNHMTRERVADPKSLPVGGTGGLRGGARIEGWRRAASRPIEGNANLVARARHGRDEPDVGTRLDVRGVF